MKLRILTLSLIPLVIGLSTASAEVPLEQTKENWANSCKKCHGDDGAGKTKAGRKLRVRDYTDPKVQAEMTEESMIKAMKEGVYDDGEELMQGYAEEYSEEQIAAFVAYIRSMGKR